MVGKILVGILALFLLLAAFASDMTDGIKAWRTDDTTQQFAVTTGAGVTAGNMTLSYDLFQAATAEVQSISSNNTNDVPVPIGYIESTKSLEVGGLEAAEVRTLTVNYLAEDTNEVMRVTGAFLGIIVVGGCIGLILWGMFKKGR